MNILTYVHLRNIYRSTGAGRVAREMTEHLAQQPGVNLEILADAGDHRRMSGQVGQPWTEFNYHFVQHDTSRQQYQWYLFNRPAAENYWKDADLVYCTGESYVPKRKRRLAVTVHDAQLFDRGAHRPTPALLKQRWKWQLLFGRLARETDLFHTVSKFSADRLAHYFPAISSRLRVVPNAVSQLFFEPTTERGRAIVSRLRIEQNPYILVPGGLHFRKNADLILEAWPRIQATNRELRLVIAGHNDPAYIARADAFDPRIIRTGFLEDDELCALYAQAQLVWFPSRYEGFGLPVVEAMAAGAPVVTSDSTAIPEVAGGAAVLVSPDRPTDHIDAILGLLGSTSERASLRDRGFARARQFTWESSAAQLVAHFAAVL